jgi:CspA family cold shock protein
MEKEAVNSARKTGVVKFFDEEKGYGFISRPGHSDLFVHFTGIRGSGRRNLKKDQEVEFEIGEGRKGPEAQGVQILSGGEEEASE